MSRPQDLHNPIALSSIGGVAVVRGCVYIAHHFPLPDWLGAEVGPGIPFLPLWVVGLMWVVTGLFLFASLWVWRWFRSAIALITGMYTAWAIIHVTDLFISPDLASIVSLSIYASLIPVTITLGQMEIKDSAEQGTLDTKGV